MSSVANAVPVMRVRVANEHQHPLWAIIEWCMALIVAWVLLGLGSVPAHAKTVGYWRFEEGIANAVVTGSNTVLDASGNGFHGTPFLGPVYRSVTNPGSRLGLHFGDNLSDPNYLGQRVLIADNPAFQLTHSLTLEAFILYDGIEPGTRHWSQIVFRGDSRVALDPYLLAVALDGRLAFQVGDAFGKQATVYSTNPIPVGAFIHVAGTLDDATGAQKLFINGVEVASQTTAIRPFGPLAPILPGLSIGNVQDDFNHELFKGIIDEVRVSDAALSPAEFLPALVGESILLTPFIVTNPVGTPHTVTARVVNDLGQAASGRVVDFQVISGPNAGTSNSGTTNSNGEASFTYIGTGSPGTSGAGTDVIVAGFTDSTGRRRTSNEVQETWVVKVLGPHGRDALSCRGATTCSIPLTCPLSPALSCISEVRVLVARRFLPRRTALSNPDTAANTRRRMIVFASSRVVIIPPGATQDVALRLTKLGRRIARSNRRSLRGLMEIRSSAAGATITSTRVGIRIRRR